VQIFSTTPNLKEDKEIMERTTYSHGARIRLLEIDRWHEGHYVIQEWIPELLYPGPYQIYPGWHNRDAPYPASDKQAAIEMFKRYQREGIPHPVWDCDYMPIGDCRVISEGVIKEKKALVSEDMCDALAYGFHVLKMAGSNRCLSTAILNESL
jgi:hypothetical protein